MRVANPISADNVTLRTTLAPNILAAMELNSKNFNEFRLFEIGRVFRATHTDEGIPTQAYHIGILAYARAARKADQLEVLFREARGVVERFVDIHGFMPVTMCERAAGFPELPWMHPVAALALRIGDAVVGYITVVHPAVMRGLDVLGGAVYVDFDVDALMASPRRPAGFRAIPRFPSSQLDLSLVVPTRTFASTLLDAIRAGGGQYLYSLELTDVYTGKPIPDGFKSVTFRLTFQASDRTLSDDEIKASVESITARARQAGASLWGETGSGAN